MDEFFLIAKIQSAGKNGFVKVQLIPGFFDNLSKIKYMFLDFWNQKKKIELEDFVNNKNSIFFKFKNFDDERDTSVLLDRDVFVSDNDLKLFKLDTILEKNVIGFAVYKNQELIGSVSDYFETPANSVVEVKVNSEKVILIPFVDDIFEKIDYKKKELVINPDFGLNDDED